MQVWAAAVRALGLMGLYLPLTAYPAVYNNCQGVVTMLVDKISRHDKTKLTEGFTVLTEGFTSVVDLTRWLYGHQRTSVTRSYHKEVPHILQVYPKLLLVQLKSFSSHPIQFFKLALNHVKTWRLGQDYRAQLVREDLVMMQLEILPKGSIQAALKKGQEERHVNKDEEDDDEGEDDEDNEDDEGTAAAEEESYAYVENILNECTMQSMRNIALRKS